MSIIYCDKHDRKWDSDCLDECPLCENEHGSADSPERRLLREWLDWWDGEKGPDEDPPTRQTRALLSRSEGGQELPLTAARRLVEAQAKDAALWFVAQTAPESYLQAALRRLHTAVEGETNAAGQIRSTEAPTASPGSDSPTPAPAAASAATPESDTIFEEAKQFFTGNAGGNYWLMGAIDILMRGLHRLERERDAAIERERLANMRADQAEEARDAAQSARLGIDCEAVGWWTGKEAKFEPGKIPAEGALLFRPTDKNSDVSI